MWEKIIQIGKTASAMLRSGETPPNTPPKFKEDLSKINFLASKKFYVVFCSVVILTVFYAASIVVLFLTAWLPTLTIPFVSIFTETIKLLAVIIASYLGVQTILDYKMQSSSSVELTGEYSYSRQELDEQIITACAEKYKDDLSYAPLNWIHKEDSTDNE